MKPLNRRDFITHTSLLASSVYAGPALAVKPRRKLGVALVGLGYYSRDILAPALELTERCELRGIVTGTPSKIPVWQQRYGIKDSNIYNYGNMHELANNPDIDIAYIVTPTGTHLKYASVAANAGKHVWCEKPMAMTVAECQQMIATCAKNKVQLAIGYRMLHEKNTQTIIEYAKTQPFGVMTSLIAEAGYRGGEPSAGNWRLDPAQGGGALYDMGVYPICAARYATQLMPVAVSAHQESKRAAFSKVDESSRFTLKFANGLEAKCATSVGESMNQLRVNCQRGWYELTPMQSYSTVQGRTSSNTLLTPQKNNQQATQMDNDSLAIIHNKPVIASGDEGMRDIAIVQAAMASANKSAAWVDITL